MNFLYIAFDKWEYQNNAEKSKIHFGNSRESSDKKHQIYYAHNYIDKDLLPQTTRDPFVRLPFPGSASFMQMLRIMSATKHMKCMNPITTAKTYGM